MSDEFAARAEMKRRFFNFIEEMDNKDVTVQLYGKTTLSVKLLAMQPNGNHFIVENLKTPTGLMQHAVLRSNDTMFLSIPLPDT